MVLGSILWLKFVLITVLSRTLLNIDVIFSFAFLQVISSYEYTNEGPER